MTLSHEAERRARRREYDTKRQTEQPWRAWYKTARWRDLRAAQLRAEPHCRMCRPHTVRATVCDHVIPHRGDERRFWSGPFQSLCRLHHDSTKQREERGRSVKAVGLDGWPIE